jgi:hypothetical protein
VCCARHRHVEQASSCIGKKGVERRKVGDPGGPRRCASGWGLGRRAPGDASPRGAAWSRTRFTRAGATSEARAALSSLEERSRGRRRRGEDARRAALDAALAAGDSEGARRAMRAAAWSRTRFTRAGATSEARAALSSLESSSRAVDDAAGKMGSTSRCCHRTP